MKSDILIKQIKKKFKRLTELESQLKTEFITNEGNVKISRKIFACIDGFIILRTFSTTNLDDFQFIAHKERLDTVIKLGIPIKTSDGLMNLYQILKSSIGLELRVGQTIDIGSMGGGLTVGGRLKMDGFQILIRDYKNIEQTQEVIEDMFIAQEAYRSDIKINALEKEIEDLRKAISLFSNKHDPLIITEGKTDWKYFITALKYFHTQREFLKIDENWFLKFGSSSDLLAKNCQTDFELENSSSNLLKILNAFIESRSIEQPKYMPLRIGIFDSDEKKVNPISDIQRNVFSFRIEPEEISTEFLFCDEEIKTAVNGRRLYIGNEFDSETGQLLRNRSISLGNDNNTRNKAGKRVIIDTKVYNNQGQNIALPKEEFAKAIFDNTISIGIESWLKFRHVFEKIETLLAQLVTAG